MANAKKLAHGQQVKKSVGVARGHSTPRNSVVASVGRMYRRGAPMLICEALLFFIAALVLIIRPVLVLTIFTYIIGVALLAFGLYRMISGFVASDDNGGGGIDVVFGVINIVLGIYYLAFRKNNQAPEDAGPKPRRGAGIQPRVKRSGTRGSVPPKTNPERVARKSRSST